MFKTMDEKEKRKQRAMSDKLMADIMLFEAAAARMLGWGHLWPEEEEAIKTAISAVEAVEMDERERRKEEGLL